jgi:hypothetical protein
MASCMGSAIAMRAAMLGIELRVLEVERTSTSKSSAGYHPVQTVPHGNPRHVWRTKENAACGGSGLPSLVSR